MRRLAILVLFCAVRVLAQPESGELRLRVTDSSGTGVRSAIELRSEVSGFVTTAGTDASGQLAIEHVPFGIYSLRVTSNGFAYFTENVGVHSALPIELAVQLSIEPSRTTVNVNDERSLLDPDEPTSVQRIGSAQIEDRPAALPGRSLQDLVNQQPGWLYEGNAVLHPRGSEYQAQYIVDGIPLTENRSPGVGPEFDAEDVASMSVYTAGYPAEFGRKLGGVIEINTARDTDEGVHGEVRVGGGSFDTRESYARLQDRWGANTLTVSGNVGSTDWFLNPPTLQNFTNRGTDAGESLSYERDLNPKNRVSLGLRHDQARFQVPNELLQEAAGQRQDRATDETIGTFGFQHIFNESLLADVHFMARSVDAALQSNLLSTPIVAAQNRTFDEQYLKTTVSYHRGMHEWKAGAEADFSTVEERFSYTVTDMADFDPGVPTTFSFTGSAPDREQSAFIQDVIDLGDWTASAGIRWDHYRLLVDRNALSPRLGIARAFPKSGLILHASYDRIFQTPASENLLLSSSPQVTALDPEVLRLPVKPSLGNYFELGGAKQFGGVVRLDLNCFYRSVSDFADDDLLLNTSISFPIAFRKANVYGGETKLELARWKRFSGSAAYSYLVGHAFLPVTGGLFLGSDVNDALSSITGKIAISQDQRNTLRTNLRYEITPRVWTAFSAAYGSGLPVEFLGTRAAALAEYGPDVVARVNFERARVRPNLAMNISASAEFWRQERKSIRLQGDVENLTNRVNLINFAGLFSGNTVDTPRTYHARLVLAF